MQGILSDITNRQYINIMMCYTMYVYMSVIYVCDVLLYYLCVITSTVLVYRTINPSTYTYSILDIHVLYIYAHTCTRIILIPLQAQHKYLMPSIYVWFHKGTRPWHASEVSDDIQPLILECPKPQKSFSSSTETKFQTWQKRPSSSQPKWVKS